MDTRTFPYSWGDIADALNIAASGNGLPEHLVKAEIYWDSLVLVTDAGDDLAVKDWLSHTFPFRFREGQLSLDGPAFSRQLPVTFDRYDSDVHGAIPPSMAQQYVAASTEIWFKRRPSGPIPKQVVFPTFAFHSVKGGVGRTTSAISFALGLAAEGLKPLLVDADFEAPGISYLFLNDGRECHASLEDLFVLSHADDEPDADRTVRFLSEKLQNQKHEGITFLPCIRNADMLSAFAIRPEQLQRSHAEQPFFIVNLLRRLAHLSGCDVLIIDLRAGFTDLAAMTLSAPNVSPVFVSTPSGQAVYSTQEMMRFIASQSRKDGNWRGRPAVIVNNVIPQVRRSADFQNILSSFDEDIREFWSETDFGADAGSIIDFNRDDVSGAAIVALDHSPALTAAPAGLADFIDDLKGQPCFDQLGLALREWSREQLELASDVPQEVPDNASTPSILSEKRHKLHKFAQERVFADSTDEASDEFLVVRALRELGERFRTELPNATCIGMKGAGKTFTFRLLARMATWSDFLASVGSQTPMPNSKQALILPVLPARTLQRLEGISTSRKNAMRHLGGDEPITFSRLNELIDLSSKHLDTESEWGAFWLDVIAWSCGINVGSVGAGDTLIERLIDSGERAVALFDGLEESFQGFRGNVRQQAAIRGLTSALPQRLLEIPNRPLGQINFIRSDLVAAAFPNNYRQFADRNRAFSLTWYDRDILELAAWLAYQAEVASTWNDKFQDEDGRAIEDRLVPLWGRKLGKADALSKDGRTREPRSSEWVIAALSDLRGRLTARDLVGFIANSAKMSIPEEGSTFMDRILVPKAMKSAITPVGLQKMEAMGEENPDLKSILEMLKAAPQFSLPISLSEFKDKVAGIGDDQLEILKENGVVLVEGDSVEMPEIFRTGLGNVVRTTGGRKSIIGLMTKAKQARNSDLLL